MNERSELLKPVDLNKVQSIWFKSILSVIKRLTIDMSWQLRVVVSSVWIVSQSNDAIGNTGLIATTIFSSNANFQWGGRRLIRKV